MPTDFFGLFLVFSGFAITFAVARVLGKRFRQRRAQKAEAAALSAQSRQVRRARERNARGR